MARYIDADIFQKNLSMEVYMAEDEDFTQAFVKGMQLVKKAQDETPTADVQEVRHGKWVDHGWFLMCSICGNCTDEITCDYISADEETAEALSIPKGTVIHRSMHPLYCSRCGSKMDGNEDEAKIKELEGKE